jgi:hypothetical protein
MLISTYEDSAEISRKTKTLKRILDAPRRRPPAELVRDGVALEHHLQEPQGDEEREPGDRHCERGDDLTAREQQAERRRDQRHDDLEDRQVLLDHGSASS